jgi:hypothetical protein
MSTLPVTSGSNVFRKLFRHESETVYAHLPPALVSLQETNPTALKDAYFVDTGEPVGSDLEGLRPDAPLEEESGTVREAAELAMRRWHQLSDEERTQRVEQIAKVRRSHEVETSEKRAPNQPGA